MEKDHLKAMQKIAQVVHEDTHLRHVKFEGYVLCVCRCVCVSVCLSVCV